jgi:hypothetical protein
MGDAVKLTTWTMKALAAKGIATTDLNEALFQVDMQLADHKTLFDAVRYHVPAEPGKASPVPAWLRQRMMAAGYGHESEFRCLIDIQQHMLELEALLNALNEMAKSQRVNFSAVDKIFEQFVPILKGMMPSTLPTSLYGMGRGVAPVTTPAALPPKLPPTHRALRKKRKK